MDEKELILAWQAPQERSWYPIGRFWRVGGDYLFRYTEGANLAKKKAGFEPLLAFPDLEAIYVSEELFPLLHNRLLSKNRPEYKDYIEWLNIPEGEDEPMALLMRSGGRRATDNLEVFPCPEPDEQGIYHIHFFAHGLRHLPQASIERINQLVTGEKLNIVGEPDNPVDSNALLLQTDDKVSVGYVPRYLLDDLHTLESQCCSGEVKVIVELVNKAPAPRQFQLLCHLEGCWPDGFAPFTSVEYGPLTTGADTQPRS